MFNHTSLLRHLPATGLLATALVAFAAQSGMVLVASPTDPQDPAEQEGKPSPEDAPAYLGLRPAGLVPEVFAPGLLSLEDRYEYGCAISRDGRQIYFGVAGKNRAEIRYLQYADGKWSEDAPLLPGATFSFNDPFLNKQEDRLYFISDAAVIGDGRKQDHDIWYVQRSDDGWTKPIHGGAGLNTPFEEYFVALTDENTLYFSSNRPTDPESQEASGFDLYAAAQKGNQFTSPSKLPEALNTKHYEADVFVAPDESYLIFCSVRPEGLGQGDLYISFRQESGDWSKARSLGERVNTTGHELCPFVSKDGKYFFYTSQEDIYWVDVKLLESYR